MHLRCGHALTHARWKPVSLTALAISLSALIALTAGRATAFELDVHERIVRESLSSQMGSSQLDTVVGSFVLGTGNRGSDQHQFAPERHFDSSPDAITICDRQQQGLSAFLDDAVAASEPKSDNQGKQLTDADAALQSFGESTHAIADFYSHTNWLELAFQHGASPAPAPILGSSCDPNAFPADLQSGRNSRDASCSPMTDSQLLSYAMDRCSAGRSTAGASSISLRVGETRHA